jgi:gas vesicle protein
MAKDNKRFSAFLTGFLVGGLVGSIVALLYSPISGKKLRRKISNVKEDFVGEVNEYYETGKEKAEELVKEGKKKADHLIEEAKKLVAG